MMMMMMMMMMIIVYSIYSGKQWRIEVQIGVNPVIICAKAQHVNSW